MKINLHLRELEEFYIFGIFFKSFISYGSSSTFHKSSHVLSLDGKAQIVSPWSRRWPLARKPQDGGLKFVIILREKKKLKAKLPKIENIFGDCGHVLKTNTPPSHLNPRDSQSSSWACLVLFFEKRKSPRVHDLWWQCVSFSLFILMDERMRRFVMEDIASAGNFGSNVKIVK